MVAFFLIACESPQAVQDSEGTIDVAGGALFTHTIGAGSPILVVHGGPGLDHSYFLPHLEPLSEEFELIFYDQRASGRSTAGDSSAFTMAGFVADIDEVRASSGNERVHLMGHSWGGILALNYALAHPDRVRSLILVNPVAASTTLQQAAALRLRDRITPEDSLVSARLMASPAFQRREPAALLAFFRLTFRTSFYNPDLTNELELWFDERFAANSGMLALLYADTAFTSYDLHPRLGELTMPALIIYGVHDGISMDELQPMIDALPASRLVRLDSSGHFPFVEQPDEFASLLRGFLIEISE